MSSKQAMDSHGSGARTRLRHHPFVPRQYRHDRPWIRGKKGYGLAMGRMRMFILGFTPKLFWEKYPTRITYHPKEVKLS